MYTGDAYAIADVYSCSSQPLFLEYGRRVVVDKAKFVMESAG
jgi:hypothetical protein